MKWAIVEITLEGEPPKNDDEGEVDNEKLMDVFDKCIAAMTTGIEEICPGKFKLKVRY